MKINLIYKYLKKKKNWNFFFFLNRKNHCSFVKLLKFKYGQLPVNTLLKKVLETKYNWKCILNSCENEATVPDQNWL